MTWLTSPSSVDLERRRLGGWLLGGAAAVALTACGGGGGGDSAPTLRESFDRLEKGMTFKQVKDLVGQSPFAESSTDLHYRSGPEYLVVVFSPDAEKVQPDYVVSGASYENGAVDLYRNL